MHMRGAVSQTLIFVVLGCSNADNGTRTDADSFPDSNNAPDTGDPSLDDMVTFMNGMAVGVMTGAGSVQVDECDSVSDPVCIGNIPITSVETCTLPLWNSSSALCVTGLLAPIPPGYDGCVRSQDISISVDATSPSGGVIATAYSAITVNLNDSQRRGLEVWFRRAGDTYGLIYCAPAISGRPVKFAQFNSACWDNTGTAFPAAQAARIDRVGVRIRSDPSGVVVDNLCLNSIVFSR